MSVGWDPNVPYPPPPTHPIELALARTGPVGIFLLVVGSINLLFTLLQVLSIIQVALLTEEQFQAQNARTAEILAPYFPGVDLEKELNKPGARTQSATMGAIICGVLGLFAVLTILAGLAMRQLRNYGLAMTGSIVAVLPCPLMGCCLLGQVAGFWALAVLMDTTVRLAFHLSSLPPGAAFGGQPYPGQPYPGQPYPGQYPPGTSDPNQPRPGDGPR